MRRIFVFAKRNLKEIYRDPVSLIFLIGLPLVMLISFYYLFSSATSQFSMSHYAPGIVVFSFSFLTLFSGMLISLDKSSSLMMRLYSSPLSANEFLGGYTLSLLPVSLCQTVLFFLTASIIDNSFFTYRILLAILAVIPIFALFIGFGILFGSLCNEKSIGGVSSFLITAQSLLSGMWFPIETLNNKGFDIISRILPFRNASLYLESVVVGTDSPVNDILFPMLIVLGYAVVIYAIAVLVFKKNMKKG